MQLNLLAEKPEWLPPQSFPKIKGYVGLDFETRDPMLSKVGSGWCWARLEGGKRLDETYGYPVGVALAWREPGKKKIFQDYWPTAHQGGGNLPAGTVYGWLKSICEDPEVHLVMANAAYDLGWLVALGITPANHIHDVQLQAPLIDEHRFSYGLDSLLKDALGESKDEAALKQALKDHQLKGKGDMWRLPSPFVGPYAAQDAGGTLRLWEHQMGILEEQNLVEAYDVERELTSIIIDIRKRGMRVDIPLAERLISEIKVRELGYEQEIKRLTGRRFGPFDDALGPVLAERGLPVTYTSTGKISVTKQTLAQSNDPVVKIVRDWRRWQKCRSTFLEGHVLGYQIAGRVHAHFHQLRSEDEEGNGFGTITHRFSCSDPNLQQLPNPERDLEVGLAVRSCYLPEDGEDFGSIDYSSQEPRLITHFGALLEKIYVDQGQGHLSPVRGALAVAQRWQADPRMDPYLPIVEVASIKRKQAKDTYLSLAYGAGEGTIATRLGLPTVPKSFEKNGKTITYTGAGEEGEAIIKAFDGAAPYVRQMKNLCTERGEKKGFVIGIDGARFRAKGRHEWHKMLNKLAQGSAGRQNKRAMLAVSRAGYGRHLLGTVHDELIGSLPGGENGTVAKRVTECMVDAVKLMVPSVVDIQCGPNWGEASRPK